MRSDVEETETQKTKASDSGYSNSCSNSQSQRSSGSSKSRHSTSSGSSGFCPHLPNQNEGEKSCGKRKDKEVKKKKDGPTSSGQQQQPSPIIEAPASVETASGGPECADGSGTCHSLQTAALSQTFSAMKRIKTKDLSPDVENNSTSSAKPVSSWTRDEVMQLVSKEMTHEEELGVVVSMDDGLVIYTTPSLTQVLGYPKDMWVGRSLIDFVHPRHRASFAGHITSVIASSDTNSNRRNHYSCYLRQYRGLRNSGFSIIEKWVGYLPFQLSMSFKETEGEAPNVYLVISAVPIRSAYKYGDETRMSTKFTTRHTASSQLCHVDPEVTPYFGYLPQDIIGRSILEFYHPEDLHFLKEVYEAVMKEQGHLFRSKPYRFRCQNGGFALVETELSSFINPWSRKLEFIICQHTVLRGPPNPDVTTPISEPEALQISEEVLKETKIVQEEIKCLLNETVVRNYETAKQQVTKRCKDLAAFMENLMDELTKPPNLKVDVPTEEQSFSERDSVMLGEISPHHEYYDSKSSSETPPSYNQLNYNENLQRFFESKPKTTVSDESADSKSGGSAGEGGEISPVVESIGDSKSGGSGGSSGAQSTESSGETTTNGSNNNSAKNYKPATLTEQLLSRHNEDMEKRMVQKHRESRAKSDRDTKIKERMKTSLEKSQEDCSNTHGIKRSGSHSWEGEPYKSIKAAHNSNETTPPIPPPHEPEKTSPVFPTYSPRPEFPPTAYASTVMPMYYLANRRPDIPMFPQQMPFVPSMVYHPVVFSPQPVVAYSPVTVIPASDISCPPPPPPSHQNDNLPQPQATSELKTAPSTSSYNKESNENLVQDQKTESNETSVPFDDSSSSFYSLLKTDKSDESLRSSSENETKQDVPPWVEDINVTPDLILKYQLRERPLEQVLSQDLRVLESISQPELVSEQLSQMYLDLEVEGLSQHLMLEEGETSSSESSGDESKSTNTRHKKYMEYDKMVILFEEDAPLPPPIAQDQVEEAAIAKP